MKDRRPLELIEAFYNAACWFKFLVYLATLGLILVMFCALWDYYHPEKITAVSGTANRITTSGAVSIDTAASNRSLRTSPPLTSGALPGQAFQTGFFMRVNDSIAYQLAARPAHEAGYADIYFNNQANRPHFDIWNGKDYTHFYIKTPSHHGKK